MEFMEFPPRKKRTSLIVHATIVLVSAATLAAFGIADDEVTGRAQVSDAYGFTLIFLVAGYYLGWLPAIWRKCRGTAFETCVMPAFIALVLAYLYLSFRAYFIQPGVTALAVFTHLFVLICLSCRFE